MRPRKASPSGWDRELTYRVSYPLPKLVACPSRKSSANLLGEGKVLTLAELSGEL
jgi:hypothetical protein